MEFKNIQKDTTGRTIRFTLSPVHVSYANTLRRLILTGVETIAFRSDMTSVGTTTDVVVKQNDTPMTNEMLADRIGLLPLNVKEPLKWKESDYQFQLKVKSLPDQVRYVTASDFRVVRLSGGWEQQKEEEEKKGAEAEEATVPTEQFFPPHPLTRQTCLIATLPPGSTTKEQHIEIIARATKGTGREHARFSPVSQCSYEYTPDNDPERIRTMLESWMIHTKMVQDMDPSSARYAELEREFRTMQIKRCYQMNEKGEPYSYDFTIESLGVLPVSYIVQRACEVGENMCSKYVNLGSGALPSEITIAHASNRVIGYDILFRGHDHTLGNLLQTWMVEHLIEGKEEPHIDYAGYNVPHPLRDEMVLRIGVNDGSEITARKAVAAAAAGCVKLFQDMRQAWRRVEGPVASVASVASVAPRSRRPGASSALKAAVASSSSPAMRPLPPPRPSSAAAASPSTPSAAAASPKVSVSKLPSSE